MVRADYSHVDGDLAPPANPLDRALLQKPKQLRLQRERHIADLVEKQRTAAGELNLALGGFGGPGKGTLFKAEQLGLEQVLRNGRTVNSDEGVLRTRTEVVQGPREQFLAGAGLAEQKRRHIGWRDLLDHAADMQHALAGSDDAIEWRMAVVGEQPPVLVLEIGNVESPRDEQLQRIGIDRLLIKIVGTKPNRFDGVVLVAVAGDDDYLGTRRKAQNFLERLEALGNALGVGRQTEILQDHSGLVATKLIDSGLARIRNQNVVIGEAPFELALQTFVVLNDQ